MQKSQLPNEHLLAMWEIDKRELQVNQINHHLRNRIQATHTHKHTDTQKERRKKPMHAFTLILMLVHFHAFALRIVMSNTKQEKTILK